VTCDGVEMIPAEIDVHSAVWVVLRRRHIDSVLAVVERRTAVLSG